MEIWRNLQAKLAFKIDIFKRSYKFWRKNDENLGKFLFKFYRKFSRKFKFKYKIAKIDMCDFSGFIKISHLNLIFQNLHLAFGIAILHNGLKFSISKIKLLKVALNFKIWCEKYKLNANLLICFYQILRSNFTLKFLLENSFKIQISHCFLPNILNFITKFSQNLLAPKTLKNIFQIVPQSLNFTPEFLKINI